MKKKMMVPVFLLAAVFLFTACGISGSTSAKKGKNVSGAENMADRTGKEQPDTQDKADLLQNPDDVYIIAENDLLNYQMTLLNPADGSRICYEYTEGTEFFDKYGNYALGEEFSEGKLAVITRLNSNDTLGAVSFTDHTWSYEDVRNYSIDAEKDRITIADTVYRCNEGMKVFSDGLETNVYAIGSNDVLNIYGIDRTIYSVVVKSGHGTLELVNTELFEGGWMNLGTQVYTVVTRDMSLEIPEGVYEFSVANDGYGDEGEVSILRDQTTTIDLNDYKGEGPKMCQLTFNVSVEGAVIRVDGKKVNPSKPLEVRYGVHTLGVRARDYDDWNRQLVINSPTANIDILLTEDSGSSGSMDTQDTDTSRGSTDSRNSAKTSGKAGSLAGSMAGSLAGAGSGDNSGGTSGGEVSGNKSSSSLAGAALGSSLAGILTGGDSTDYLDTLSDLVKSLDKLNSASSEKGD